MTVISTEARKDFMKVAIRQLDSFWKDKSVVLDQIIISYEKKYIILQKVNKSLILAALIRQNTPIGLATLLLEEMAEKIKSMFDLALVNSLP